MIPLLTISFLLGLTAVLVILWPLLELRSTVEKQPKLLREFERLQFEKERLLNNLKDLELDFQTKKITEADYSDLRNQLLEEASGIYSALDDIEKKSEVFQRISKDLATTERELSL